MNILSEMIITMFSSSSEGSTWTSALKVEDATGGEVGLAQGGKALVASYPSQRVGVSSSNEEVFWKIIVKDF